MVARSDDNDNVVEIGTAHPSLALRLSLAGLSAASAQFACQPIETIKTRMQLREPGVSSRFEGYISFRTGAQTLVREEGCIALWKGMTPSFLREISYSSLRYGLFVPIQSALGNDEGRDPSVWKRYVAGGLSGGIGASISSPTDLLKARMQADTSPRPQRLMDHVRAIYAAGGLRSFWTGVGTTVSRAVVLGATNLGTYTTAKDLMGRKWGLLDDGLPLQAAASVVAGFAISLTTAPIDFARSRLMCCASSINYRNGFHVLINVIRRDGLLATYRGFLPQWARCAPYTVLQYVAWEQACRALSIRAV